MKEQLISFETAKLAKEKRFDWETSYGYDIQHKDLTDHTIIHNEGNYMWSEELETEIYYIEDYSSDRRHNYVRDIYNWNNSNYYYSAPTQSLLQKWLREEHEIYVDVLSNNMNKKINFTVRYYNFKKLKIEVIGNYPVYEEALEKGLYESLKLI
jgi:hypothetical protein